MDDNRERQTQGSEAADALQLIQTVRGAIRTVTEEDLRGQAGAAPDHVVDFLWMVASISRLQQRDDGGDDISDGEIKALVDGLYAAAMGLDAFSDLDRLRVIAALLELLVGYDLRWLGSSLVERVPELDLEALDGDERTEVAALLATVVVYQVAQFQDTGELDDDVVDLFEVGLALAALRPDDEVLREALADGVRHYATLECWEIMAPIREEEYEADTLPDAIHGAVAELADLIGAPRFVLLSLLLLVQDIAASGAVASEMPPGHLALVALGVLHEEDNEEPFEEPGLAQWAGMEAEDLRAAVTAAREGIADIGAEEEDPFVRQCRRWRIATLDPGFVPSRFVAADEEPLELDDEGVKTVLTELADVAWLMIHPGEVVRFFVDRFDLAEDEEMDEEVLAEALELWKSSSPVVRDLLASNPELEAQLSLS